MSELERFRVKPGDHVDLGQHDPGDSTPFGDRKEHAEAKTEELRLRLEKLQELLYATHEPSVLIVLQGMDTAGKDGTIRHVFSGVNPQGVRVSQFRQPSVEELEHDFLWRVHARAPRRGEITIFNRSHYEDVLVVRVHKLVPESVWRPRYELINAFEQELREAGTQVLKFFLHISRKEQTQRLQERLDDASKHWKFSESDLKEREFWSEYRQAYEEMLGRTSTKHAPWYVVPSDHKWFRNWLVSSVLVETLDGLDLHFPKGPPGLSSVRLG